MKKVLFSLILIVVLCVNSFASLTFAIGSLDKVSISTSNNYFGNTGSICALIYPTTVDNSYQAIVEQTKSDFSHYAGLGFGANNAGDFSVFLKRATSQLKVQTNGSVVSANSWQWVCGSWNTSGTPKLYYGALGSQITEVGSYLAQTAGSGTVSTPTNEPLVIGNNSTFSESFGGRIDRVMMSTTELNAAQINAWVSSPQSQNLFGFWILGKTDAVTVVDYSGNAQNGSVTTATLTANAQMRGVFGY